MRKKNEVFRMERVKFSLAGSVWSLYQEMSLEQQASDLLESKQRSRKRWELV